MDCENNGRGSVPVYHGPAVDESETAPAVAAVEDAAGCALQVISLFHSRIHPILQLRLSPPVQTDHGEHNGQPTLVRSELPPLEDLLYPAELQLYEAAIRFLSAALAGASRDAKPS